MRVLGLLAVLCVLSANVRAQEVVLEHGCEALANITAGKGAAYEPGVDVNGKPVAPADVEEPMEPLAYPVAVPVNIDLIEWLNIDVPELRDAGELETTIAYLSVFEDGRIEYNGRDISDRTAILCNDEASEETGQAAAEPVNSLPAAIVPETIVAMPKEPVKSILSPEEETPKQEIPENEQE